MRIAPANLGKNFLDLFMAPSSQELKPPQIPGGSVGALVLLVKRSVNWLLLSVSSLSSFIGAAVCSRRRKSVLLASLRSA